jgi:hypothetical protein
LILEKPKTSAIASNSKKKPAEQKRPEPIIIKDRPLSGIPEKDSDKPKDPSTSKNDEKKVEKVEEPIENLEDQIEKVSAVDDPKTKEKSADSEKKKNDKKSKKDNKSKEKEKSQNEEKKVDEIVEDAKNDEKSGKDASNKDDEKPKEDENLKSNDSENVAAADLEKPTEKVSEIDSTKNSENKDDSSDPSGPEVDEKIEKVEEKSLEANKKTYGLNENNEKNSSTKSKDFESKKQLLEEPKYELRIRGEIHAKRCLPNFYDKPYFLKLQKELQKDLKTRIKNLKKSRKADWTEGVFTEERKQYKPSLIKRKLAYPQVYVIREYLFK